MSKFLEKWENVYKNRDYCKSIATNPGLHRASQEVADTLEKLNVFSEVDSVFEIGCNMGRNLSYLLQKKPKMKVYGNDLYKDRCYSFMPKDLQEKLNFLQIDSRSLVTSEFGKENKIDLFLSCDHLMHLDPETVQLICEKVSTEWKPKYIVIRETSKTTEDRTESSVLPRLSHEYKFDNSYKLILEKNCKEGFEKVKNKRDFLLGFFKKKEENPYKIRVYKHSVN